MYIYYDVLYCQDQEPLFLQKQSFRSSNFIYFFQYLFGIISLRIMKGEKGAQYFFFCFIVLVINKLVY